MKHPPLVIQTTLRMALACWLVDLDHGMTPSQHAWLTTRLKDVTPLTPEERARLPEPLLAWCTRLGGAWLKDVVERQYNAAPGDLQDMAGGTHEQEVHQDKTPRHTDLLAEDSGYSAAIAG